MAEWPACQVRTTISDLTKYLLAFTSESGPESESCCPILSQASRQLLLPNDMCKGLAWWGMDTSYGDRHGISWTHGGYMEGVRTHFYLFPPTDRRQPPSTRWEGYIILTNGESSYEEISDALEEGLAYFRTN